MRVSASPEFLQSIIDHPQVKPWVAPDGVSELPLAHVFHEGIGLEFETGGFFFHRLGDGIYEVHTLFLPGTKNAFECCQAVAHYMFCGTDCVRIVTKVPADNVPAWKLTEKMQFTQDYVRPQAYTRGGQLHDVKHYALTMDLWARGQRSPQWVKGQCDALGNTAKGSRFLYRWAVMNDDPTVLET